MPDALGIIEKKKRHDSVTPPTQTLDAGDVDALSAAFRARYIRMASTLDIRGFRPLFPSLDFFFSTRPPSTLVFCLVPSPLVLLAVFSFTGCFWAGERPESVGV